MEIIDPIFNLHKIKFDILDKWNLVDQKTQRVNVYINLDNVFKVIMTSRTNNFIQAASSVSGYDEYMNYVAKSLVSNIINLGQHYRLWLAKKSIESRIILYWNFPLPERFKNAKYLPTYRSDYIDKHTTSMDTSHILSAMKKATDFCQKCISYVNEVYLIQPGEIESSLVPYILQKEIYEKDGIPTKNILVSNTLYDFMYVNYGFTIVAPSIKRKKPYKVTKENVIEVIKDKYKVSSVLTVNPNFLDFIISLLGDHDRNIPSITGVGIVSIMKILCKAVSESLITTETKDIDMLSSILKSDYKDIFKRNYHCTNFDCQLKDVEPLDIHRITSLLIDNYDEATLKEMNEKYFKRCPIELIRPKSEQVLYDHNPYGNSLFAK